jgi:hypothetical protein
MKELYKLTEFQTATGAWECGCSTHLEQNSAAWFLPARALGISIEDYIHLLIDKYHIIPISYTEYPDKDWPSFFYFKWPDYNTMHSFVLYVNREAKKRNFFIDWAD